MNVLAKISGDLVNDKNILEQLIELSKDNKVTLIHGCGTRISNALKNRNIQFEFRNGIRYTNSKGLDICFYECQLIRQELERKLDNYNIKIISPVSKRNGNITNRNAEEIFREEYDKYDRWIVYTKSDRKKPFIDGLANVEVTKVI